MDFLGSFAPKLRSVGRRSQWLVRSVCLGVRCDGGAHSMPPVECRFLRGH